MNAALATRPDISTSNLQLIFDYISTAMVSASASASAIVLQGTRILIEPMTARTANLKEAMCFSPVMELSRGSLESKASSPCQLPYRHVNSQGRVHRLLGCIVNYSYVHTDENVADILTKAMGLW